MCMSCSLFVTICEHVKMSTSSDESDYVDSLSEEETSTSEDEDDNDYLQRLLSASFFCVVSERELRDSLLSQGRDFYLGTL